MKQFYIGARYNPQLKQPYIVAYGQLTKKDAKLKTECVYGSMSIEGLKNQADYDAKLNEYREQGLSVRS